MSWILKWTARAFLIAVAIAWLSVVLGLPLLCAREQFGSWLSAIELFLAVIGGVAAFMSLLVLAGKYAGWD